MPSLYFFSFLCVLWQIWTWSTSLFEKCIEIVRVLHQPLQAGRVDRTRDTAKTPAPTNCSWLVCGNREQFWRSQGCGSKGSVCSLFCSRFTFWNTFCNTLFKGKVILEHFCVFEADFLWRCNPPQLTCNSVKKKHPCIFGRPSISHKASGSSLCQNKVCGSTYFSNFKLKHIFYCILVDCKYPSCVTSMTYPTHSYPTHSRRRCSLFTTR